MLIFTNLFEDINVSVFSRNQIKIATRKPKTIFNFGTERVPYMWPCPRQKEGDEGDDITRELRRRSACHDIYILVLDRMI